MATSDALIVGEDWISEHYFTTDATKESFQAKVLERRKQWQAPKPPLCWCRIAFMPVRVVHRHGVGCQRVSGSNGVSVRAAKYNRI